MVDISIFKFFVVLPISIKSLYNSIFNGNIEFKNKYTYFTY